MGGKGRPRPHSSTENTFFPSPMESVSPTVPLAHDSTHTPDHVTAQPIMQGDNESAHGHQHGSDRSYTDAFRASNNNEPSNFQQQHTPPGQLPSPSFNQTVLPGFQPIQHGMSTPAQPYYSSPVTSYAHERAFIPQQYFAPIAWQQQQPTAHTQVPSRQHQARRR